MSRTGVQSSASLKVKTVTNSATNLYKFVSLILVAVSATVAFITLRKPIEASGDPDQSIVKKMPEEYTRLEYTDPEDRDVFHGFKTSFIPQEEIRLASNRVKRRADVDDELYELNDTDFWWLAPESYQSNRYSRVKRRSEAETRTTDEYWINEDKSKFDDKSRDLSYDEYVTQGTDKNVNDDNRSIEAVIRSNMHVDRGPLDDVVEQMRGQPELEEGEMGISAHMYKPARSYTVMHAFWKGQGDRETIRRTQSHIMKQYMDEEADPCQDFYQYACGNWAALNPIPADKAGYDTFEILRENLDAVLKDLLEFKPNEKISTNYPGPHLDLNEHFVTGISFPDKSLDWNRNSSNVHIKKTDLINRIRRYLDKKTSQFLRPLKKIKKYHSKQKQNKKKYQTKIRKKRLAKFKPRSNRNRRNHVIVSFKTRYNKIVKREVQNATLNQKKDTANADVANGDAALKARYLFKSCMNYEILKRRGHQPLLDLLKLLGGWPILDPDWDGNNFDWLELMAKLRLYNNDILISEWVGPDIKNSDEFVIQFDQTSLGLPSREYFLLDCNKPYLEAYKLYLIKIALLLGGEPTHVNKSAADLILFEKRLAKITSTPEDRRNVSELYRRMSIAKLEELVPQVKWRRYLCVVMNRTVKPEETVVLFALSYVQHLVSLIEETEVNTLSNYLMWRFVRHRVNNLDDRFQAAKQQFYFVLFGREQAPPRWKNCISQVNSNMGMALGSMFVRKYFDETSKNDTLTMTREIQQSFRELLHLTDWIDDETKKLAAHKVDAMMLRIGYPDFILNKEELDDRYKEVLIHPDKYFENILNILQHLTKMEQARLGQPVNKTLWNTAPAVVNAYYSRNKNQIMFPAGILQPPFYHRHFPRSLNYGGIGVVIGHEITHGFDDKGRLFDCDGNLHRWWSDSAIGSFHLRAQCLIDQYGRYVVPEVNMKLDGVNTQGENIADNGGVKQAFRAYLHWLQLHGSEGETLPGLNHTHKQLFFLNFAQVWCGAMRPEAMRNKLKTAVHSPGRFRVIGTLSNSRDFAREFHCPVGSPMNPEEKCSVW